ncbi:MAG: glycosyltransferase family 4 protein, partial [Candidatus Latescibacterota bacterium]
IHCGQLFSAGFVGWACSRRFRAVRYFPYVHGADLLEFRDRFPWGWMLRRILGGAERVIVNSRFTGRAVATCGVPPERILVVNPSIDPSRFDGPHDREAIRQRLGWTGAEVILSVGRLVARKGHDTVIRALPRLAEVVPGVRYAVVGDGPIRAELESLATAEGVEQRVEFRGFVPDAELPTLYAAADLFAMVSRQIPASGDVEGFGIVYLEANAAGLAVLAGRSGGVEDAVVDEETGLLVDPEKPDEVVAALGRLLRDPALRGRLGEQGRQRVWRQFDRRVQAQRLWEACR